MFDIGFFELFLLFVIALLVLGPERLPVAARTVGRWAGRARGFVRSMTNELEREVRQNELAESLREAKQTVEQAASTAQQQADELTTGVKDLQSAGTGDHSDGATSPQARAAASGQKDAG